jgi:hypothetical protein
MWNPFNITLISFYRYHLDTLHCFITNYLINKVNPQLNLVIFYVKYVLYYAYTLRIWCWQAESGRYEEREDFTVQFQPTFQDAEFPVRRDRNGRITTDYSYLAADCFHYSQKLHALGIIKDIKIHLQKY